MTLPVAQRIKRISRILPAVLASLLFTGCAMVGPDYTREEPDAPQAWHSDLVGGLGAENPTPETLAHWWTTLNDDELNTLIARAVTSNLDLKSAQARVREARALRGISRASLFPTLDGDASVSKYRSSENGITGKGSENDLYAAGFDAGWELDIFGGIRRSVEAAQANLEASQENLNDVLVSLMAEVALNYVELRTYQTRMTQTRANIESQQHTYELNQSRFEAGIINELPVQQSLYNLERTRSHISTLHIGLEAAKNRLAVLLGQRPGVLEQELSSEKAIPVVPPSVAVGVPAETLRHRPDIRLAERNLAAQTARIGVATADLYPKFHLFGTIGLESLASADFFDSASRVWRIGPGISWNIFQGGALRQNIEVQNALQEQALIAYETALLEALEEVENALVAYAREQRRMESLGAATTAAKSAAQLAEDQFQAGLVDFSNVLDAQRAQLNFEDELAQSEGGVTANLIRLYKALGGGWVSEVKKQETTEQE
ncbi:MAG: efflux transporter outer membrane subunit [Desulfobulbaceae bacterium]|nr:efflux transporter outer membrane subunit [Desulfobulbaceae bacterium]